MIRDILKEMEQIDARLQALKGMELCPQEELRALTYRRSLLEEQCANLTPEDKVFLARHPRRPKTEDFIQALFTDFFEQKGDRQCREDAGIIGGIALYKDRPVTVLGHRKGHNLQENLQFNFGMPGPEGYRKALRIMKQAEKFGRPIITFIDTPGAYPGREAEERGQGEAIARCLAEMSRLEVPVVSVVTGEGNSGGALAIGVANRLIMLENAVYSVLSPEGFASILWKDSSRKAEACEMMKLTAQDLLQFEVIEEIIPEPLGGAQEDPDRVFRAVDLALERSLNALSRMNREDLQAQRYEKYRKMGTEL